MARHHWFVTPVLGLAVVLLFLGLVMLLQTHQQQLAGFSDTVALSPKNVDPTCVYDQSTFTSNNRIVLYYAPWSDASTTFRPEFDAAAKQSTANVCFVTVNADAQTAGSSCLKVKSAIGLPTVQLEIGSDTNPHAVFNGARTAAALTTWVNTLTL